MSDPASATTGSKAENALLASGRAQRDRAMLMNARTLKTTMLALAGTAMLATTAPASAQGAIDNFLQEMGLQSSKRKPIDYRERAPLVMPKGGEAQLPPPQQAAADPSWPVDPDIQAEIDAEANRPTQRQQLRGQEDLRISREELARGRRAKEDYDDANRVRRTEPRVVMSPNELTAVRDAGQETAAAPYVEPERRRLTDPPEGYRTPAATASYQEGENIEKRRKSRFFERVSPWQNANQ
jgi:hypothetical protein